MRFGSAEMESFSSASLITRATNDVQQVQMVIVMFLRMVLYAPVLAAFGIFRVTQYHAGMGWIIVLAVVILCACIGILMGFAMPKFRIMQQLVDRLNLVSRELLGKARVIDLSADFRLKDVAVYEKWYGITHPNPELIAEAEEAYKMVENAGKQKMQMCIDALLPLIPEAVAGIFTGDVIQRIVQTVFDSMKEFADYSIDKAAEQLAGKDAAK